MRPYLSIFILLSYFFFACNKKPASHRYEVNTGEIHFSIPNTEDEQITLLVGPVNMDSIIRSKLNVDINRIGQTETILLSVKMKIIDSNAANKWSGFYSMDIICLDNKLFLCDLFKDYYIDDTANSHLTIIPKKANSLSSIFINKESAFYQITLKPKQKLNHPIACKMALSYRVEMTELVRAKD